MPADYPPLTRAQEFCQSLGLKLPILLAPMAGACPPALSIAVAKAGGMGACGGVLMSPQAITRWVQDLRAETDAPIQLNLWTPDPPPARNAQAETAMRRFLANWGPAVPEEAAEAPRPDFQAQCDAMLAARPTVISSIMGLYPADMVSQMKAAGIRWFATVTTLNEARAAQAAGAEALIAQGAEAGGHRGSFTPENADSQQIGLFSLIPALAAGTSLPIIAAGGISDGRGIAAALLLGASAVQLGTAYLRCPETALPPAWAQALPRTAPEDTVLTRAFSGRLGRALRSAYTEAAAAPDAPPPAPSPVQRALTGPMRAAALAENDLSRMQAWAGQSAGRTRAIGAAELTHTLWQETRALLAPQNGMAR